MRGSQQFQAAQGVSAFDEDAKIQFGGFDYLILKQVMKVNEYSNLSMYGEYKEAFINSVITLHQIAKYYWLFDDEYQQGYKGLLEMKNEAFDGRDPGAQTVNVKIPILMSQVRQVADVNSKKRYGLFVQFESDEEIEMALQDAEVMYARLHYDLLMTVISKRTKTIDQQDVWSDTVTPAGE